MFYKTLTKSNNKELIPYLVLIFAILTAWFPAVGGHPLFSEEFHYRNMLNNGFLSFCAEWMAFQGMYLLPTLQFLPI
jgi:hypothetical protein